MAEKDFSGLIKDIINHIVEDESLVEVTPAETGNSTLYYVRVAKEDLGRVIGKKGKTIEALEHLMSVWSGKYGLRLLLELEKKHERLEG